MRARRTGDWPEEPCGLDVEGWRRWEGRGRPEYDIATNKHQIPKPTTRLDLSCARRCRCDKSIVVLRLLPRHETTFTCQPSLSWLTRRTDPSIIVYDQHFLPSTKQPIYQVGNNDTLCLKISPTASRTVQIIYIPTIPTSAYGAPERSSCARGVH
jgi:hypothetical protein